MRRLSATRRRVVVLAFLASAVAVLAACSDHPTTSGTSQRSVPSEVTPIPKLYPARVAVYGDSLAMQAEPYFKLLLAANDTANTTFYSSYGGTAVCDWMAKMRKVAATMHVEAAMLEFSGNAMTPCMAGLSYGTPAYLAKYRADTMAAIALWARAGAHVFLVGAPVTRQHQQSDPHPEALNFLYATIAAADPQHVTFVDAGAAVEEPDGTYAQTLPCFIGEPCTGPVVDGVRSNVVRSADGIHFCPVTVVHRSCPVYSSGAFRFANAMVHGLATPVGSGSGTPEGSTG